MNAKIFLNPTTDKLFLAIEPRTDDDKSLLTLFAHQARKAGSKAWVDSSYLLNDGPKIIGILVDTIDKDDK